MPSASTLATSTRNGYEKLYNAQFRNTLGNLVIEKTDWKDVQYYIDKIDKPSTQHHAFVLLRKIANMAIRDRIILNNPCSNTIKLKRVEKKRKQLLEPAEVLPWIKDISKSKYSPQLYIMLGGGLRHSEAMALTWEDVFTVDSDGRSFLVLKVDKANVYISGHGLETKETKTDKSTRHVVIGEPFMSAILSHRDKPLASNTQTMRSNYRKYCNRNSIKYVAPGHLRSNFAMLHAQAGSLDSLVSISMGHTLQSTKSRNYQQTSLKSGLIIAHNLADYILNSKGGDVTISPL